MKWRLLNGASALTLEGTPWFFQVLSRGLITMFCGGNHWGLLWVESSTEVEITEEGKVPTKLILFFSVSVEQGTCDHILAPAGLSFTIPLIFLLNYVHCMITCISQAQWGLLMRERSAFPLTRCLLHQSIPKDFLKVFKVTKYVLYCFIFVIYVTTLNIYHALDINTLCLVQGNKIYMLINALTQPH